MNVYEIVTDRMVKALEQGSVPWNKPWTSRAPMNLVSKKAYRGINVLLLGWQKYSSPYWLTFNQCKMLGGCVKAGSKATPVVFWKVTNREVTENGIASVRKSFLLRYYSVFNTEQCDGLKVPALENREVSPIGAAEEIVSGYKDAPEVSFGGDRAGYGPDFDSIILPPRGSFVSDAAYYATLFHEFGHSTGHKSRLDRGLTTNFGSDAYSREELIAEMCAAFLCTTAGIDNATMKNSAAYIAGWLKQLKSDPKLVVIAAGQAQKAADWILGTGRKQEENEEGSEGEE